MEGGACLGQGTFVLKGYVATSARAWDRVTRQVPAAGAQIRYGAPVALTDQMVVKLSKNKHGKFFTSTGSVYGVQNSPDCPLPPPGRTATAPTR